MPNLNWIRRRTTIEDLLDDGVENGSAAIEPLTKLPADPSVDLGIRQRRADTLAKVRAEHSAQLRALQRRNFSVFGIVLGALIAVAGVVLVVFPVDMWVEHSRIKHLPTVWEHVTPARSRLYGSTAFIFGLVMVAYGAHRPRPE